MTKNMTNTIAIYLAGSIKKAHERSDDTYWGEADMQFLRNCLKDYEILFLNPAFRTDNLSDQRSVFGRDMLQVFSSDVVFVDARDRRGLGVGAEMMWAKYNNIPVVTLAPKDSHYNKSHTTLLDIPVVDWVHPFVESLSDHIVENLSEGAEWIRKMAESPLPVKGIDYVKSAMKYYMEMQLHHDVPMNTLINSCNILVERLGKVRKSVRI